MVEISILRGLRRRAGELNKTLVDDLLPFLHEVDEVTFRRVPSEPSTEKDVSVTTTCSALMALATNYKLEELYESKKLDPSASAKNAFDRVLVAGWHSSGLPTDNSFTRILVLRTAGILKSHGHLKEESRNLMHGSHSLQDIASEIASGIPRTLGIAKYPPTSTLGYWFLDAVTQLELNLTEGFWSTAVDWIASDFRNQLLLIDAGRDSRMDPVATAMAACLAARLHKIFRTPNFPGEGGRLANRLPSSEELRHAIQLLFKNQSGSGIWPKYFPLFHYPNAGANYCFSFELMEAVLREFEDDSLISKRGVIKRLEKAISWCVQNRLEYQYGGGSYHGWNSGGEIYSLQEGAPESWATGVVHMFLYQLRSSLSKWIEGRVLDRYASIPPTHKNPRKWDDLIDAPLELPGQKSTVKETIDTRMLKHAYEVVKLAPHMKLRKARSALLFGPPGTSKTSLVKAVGQKLGWSLVELDPSHFLKRGLESIFTLSDEIFQDLMDLSEKVVFFDELDAIVKKRGGQIDVTRQFLTTSMLPKIAQLYDNGRVLFFMATNHIADFDEAIKRPGRFDLLIFLGPPTWEQKLTGLASILRAMGVPAKDAQRQTEQIEPLLKSWIKPRSDGDLKNLLDLFTFVEFTGLLNQLCGDEEELGAALKAKGRDAFREMVREWGNRYITLREEDVGKPETPRWEYEEDRHKSRVQY